MAIEAIRSDVENTGNMNLSMRVMVPTERNIPEPARYSLLHNGKGKMLDHILVSRTMLAYFKGSEVHNELLHDESIVFAPKIFYPESDHAPVIARFDMPDTKLKWPTEAEASAEGTGEGIIKGNEEGAGIPAGKGYQCIRNGKGKCR